MPGQQGPVQQGGKTETARGTSSFLWGMGAAAGGTRGSTRGEQSVLKCPSRVHAAAGSALVMGPAGKFQRAGAAAAWHPCQDAAAPKAPAAHPAAFRSSPAC